MISVFVSFYWFDSFIFTAFDLLHERNQKRQKKISVMLAEITQNKRRPMMAMMTITFVGTPNYIAITIYCCYFDISAFHSLILFDSRVFCALATKFNESKSVFYSCFCSYMLVSFSFNFSFSSHSQRKIVIFSLKISNSHC